VTCGNSGGCPGGFALRAVVGRQYYRPYGGPRGAAVSLPTDRAFTGQYRDATGLDYFRARYFSSSLGRFVSADTIVPGAGNPQNLNRYAFVLGNPLKYTDPTGHDACTGVSGELEPDCGVDGWHGDKSRPRQSSNDLLGQFPGVKTVGAWLSQRSAELQHLATLASFAGGSMETGGFVVGGAMGTAVLAPIAAVFYPPAAGLAPVEGLPGAAIGGLIGHAVHRATTNIAESVLSTASVAASIVSDGLLGNTRVDVYDDHINIVIGQATATGLVTMAAGNINPVGILDFPIDLYASGYSTGVLPGVYDIMNMATGGRFAGEADSLIEGWTDKSWLRF